MASLPRAGTHAPELTLPSTAGRDVTLPRGTAVLPIYVDWAPTLAHVEAHRRSA